MIQLSYIAKGPKLDGQKNTKFCFSRIISDFSRSKRGAKHLAACGFIGEVCLHCFGEKLII